MNVLFGSTAVRATALHFFAQDAMRVLMLVQVRENYRIPAMFTFFFFKVSGRLRPYFLDNFTKKQDVSCK